MRRVCGIEAIKAFPTDNLPVGIAGIIKGFKAEEYGMDKPFIRKQDLFTQYGVAAAYQAIKQSGLASQGRPEHRPVQTRRLFRFRNRRIRHPVQGDRQDDRGSFRPVDLTVVHPYDDLQTSAAGHIAIMHHAEGPCLDIVTACATSTNAMGEAFRAIRNGYADAIITGGCENATIPIGIVGFANAKALSRATDPKYASLPFNANRAGFVMADGSAALVLEEYEHAKARGAQILGEMVGYGNTCDAYHSTAPRPDGTTQAKCIELALEEAGFDKEKDNLYINAHGTGTKLNDVAETLAYKNALGDFAYKAHISSIKSMTGHMFGAAGAAEAIATVLALRDGICPPTINLDTPDPECDLDYTPNKAVKTDLTLGISDSFGFGGHDACVAFRKYEG